MTNEEYIKSLPTEAFMRWISCKACPNNSIDEPCGSQCDILIEWLKAVHHD